MMWLLSILPDAVFYIAAVVGLLGFIAALLFGQIPFIGSYNLPINIISVILIAFGFYFSGGISVKDAQEKKVAELQHRIDVAEKQSSDLNTQLVELVEKNKKLAKEKNDANTQRLRDSAKKDDANCTFSNATIMLYNSTSQNGIPPSASELPGGASDVKASELLGNVAENYGTYYQVTEKLKGWQDWYKGQKQIFESVK